jgi:hypothetical protein
MTNFESNVVLFPEQNQAWKVELCCLYDSIHRKKFHHVGVGPGISFGKAVLDKFRRVDMPGQNGSKEPMPLIGLIPTAVGGTQIEHWCPDGILFSTMLQQVSGVAHTEMMGTRLRYA